MQIRGNNTTPTPRIILLRCDGVISLKHYILRALGIGAIEIYPR